MRESASSFNLAQVAAIGLIAGILLHACIVVSVLGTSEDSADQPGPSATVIAQEEPVPTETPSLTGDRTDCAAIRADPVYRSESERQYFLENCVSN